MAYRAVGFKCLVLPDPVSKDTEVKSAGGIITQFRSKQDQLQEQNAQVTGVILDIGEDFAEAYKPKTKNWGLKVGDRIWYAKYAGKWVYDKKNDRHLLVIVDEDVCLQETEDVTSLLATQETICLFRS